MMRQIVLLLIQLSTLTLGFHSSATTDSEIKVTKESTNCSLRNTTRCYSDCCTVTQYCEPMYRGCDECSRRCYVGSRYWFIHKNSSLSFCLIRCMGFLLHHMKTGHLYNMSFSEDGISTTALPPVSNVELPSCVVIGIVIAVLLLVAGTVGTVVNWRIRKQALKHRRWRNEITQEMQACLPPAISAEPSPYKSVSKAFKSRQSEQTKIKFAEVVTPMRDECRDSTATDVDFKMRLLFGDNDNSRCLDPTPHTVHFLSESSESSIHKLGENRQRREQNATDQPENSQSCVELFLHYSPQTNKRVFERQDSGYTSKPTQSSAYASSSGKVPTVVENLIDSTDTVGG